MLLRPWLLSVAFACAAGFASAATLNFAGTVSNGLGSIAGGAALSGQLVYDETTTARAGSNSNQAVFDAVTSMSFLVGGFGSSFLSAAGGPEIQIDNDLPADPDRFGLTSRVSDGLGAALLDGTYNLSGFSFRADDSTKTIYSDALTLPGTVNLADFTSASFFVFFTDSSHNVLTVDGTLTKLETIAPVPVPAALPMLLGAFATFGILGWRRRPA